IINGINLMAGNAALEDVIIRKTFCKESFNITTEIQLNQFFSASELVTNINTSQGTSNKAVMEANEFAEQGNIHQDGIIKNPLTYEIISPQTVGIPHRSLMISKHSKRHALQTTLKDLGFEANDTELAKIYRRVTALANQSKQIRARDIL